MGRLLLLIGLLVVISGFGSSSIAAPATAPKPQVVMTKDEAKFVELVNKERAKQGLSQLTIEPELIPIARAHSKEMADKKYFSHNSPTPGIKTALDRYLVATKRKPSWILVGENLFYCSIVDVDRGHTALMNSKGHRENILEGRYESIGVGAFISKSGKFYITQMFMAKVD
ncbi:MAG: CAP domain-containing protein [Armatimonadota bacterium]